MFAFDGLGDEKGPEYNGQHHDPKDGRAYTTNV
jgi:hypothetical protein